MEEEGQFSDGRPVISGGSHGSLLGLQFFIFIYDLDVNVGGVISERVDDTKVSGKEHNEEGSLRLQWDLDQLGQWAEE